MCNVNNFLLPLVITYQSITVVFVNIEYHLFSTKKKANLLLSFWILILILMKIKGPVINGMYLWKNSHLKILLPICLKTNLLKILFFFQGMYIFILCIYQSAYLILHVNKSNFRNFNYLFLDELKSSEMKVWLIRKYL